LILERRQANEERLAGLRSEARRLRQILAEPAAV